VAQEVRDLLAPGSGVGSGAAGGGGGGGV